MGDDIQEPDLELLPTATSDSTAPSRGPLVPPDDFDHGVEFEPDPPRPVPGWLRKGSFGRKRHGVVLTLAILGVGCAVFAPLPIVESMSHYFLPLGYLSYIGIGLLALSVIVWVKNRFSMERYAYVRDGIPVVGRVVSVERPITQEMLPETKQIVERFRFAVRVEYEDPESRSRSETLQLSDEQWDTKVIAQYEAGVEPGDYVTLVALPGRIAESVRLYGFLGLDPDRDFITRNGRPLTGMSPFTAVVIAMGILAGLWALVIVLFVMSSCMPEEFAWKPGLLFSAAGIVLCVIGMRVIFRLERKTAEPTKGETFGAIFCGLFFGLMGGLLAMAISNAVFDRSPAVYRPVQLGQAWSVTHKAMFRTYEVEYTELGKAKAEKKHIAYDRLGFLQGAEYGALEVRQGALGMEWIKDIHPFGWEELPEAPTAEQLQEAITFERPGVDGAPPTKFQLLPRLYVDETTTVPAPAELVVRESERLRGRLGLPMRLAP